MSGKGKKTVSKTGGKTGRTSIVKRTGIAVTKSTRSGLLFPVTRIFRQLKKGHYAKKIRLEAAIYLTGVLEYITAELLELAGNVAMDNKRVRIKPRHILLAVRSDEEVNKMLQDVTFSEGGVQPFIEPTLSKTGKSNKGASQDTDA